jgi:hypothetical protein
MMRTVAKTAAQGAACLLLLTVSTASWAENHEDAPEKPAGPSASELFMRFDEINARIAKLQKKLEAAPDKESVDAVKAELDAATAQLDELRGWAEDANERLGALESTLAEPADGEIQFDLTLSGYLRTTYTQIDDKEDQTSFVGLNDGFGQANARFIVDGEYDTTSFRLSFDGAVDRRDAGNTASGDVQTELKDAYFTWAPERWLRIHAGQFKPPFDAEERQSTRELMFVSRSVASRGVKGVEGLNLNGLSVDRQAGLMIDSDKILMDGPGIGFGYALAVTNGNGANRPLNDNDSPAFYGRLELHWKEHVTLGFAGYYNELTAGAAPDLIDEQELGLTADLSIDFHGVIAGVGFTQINSSFPDVDAEADRSAQGVQAYLGYKASYGFGYAVRWATLDPSSDFNADEATAKAAFEVDDVAYITPSLTWDVPKLPIRIQANYTVTMEDDARALDNNKFELLGQLSF